MALTSTAVQLADKYGMNLGVKDDMSDYYADNYMYTANTSVYTCIFAQCVTAKRPAHSMFVTLCNALHAQVVSLELLFFYT